MLWWQLGQYFLTFAFHFNYPLNSGPYNLKCPHSEIHLTWVNKLFLSFFQVLKEWEEITTKQKFQQEATTSSQHFTHHSDWINKLTTWLYNRMHKCQHWLKALINSTISYLDKFKSFSKVQRIYRANAEKGFNSKSGHTDASNFKTIKKIKL